MKHACSKLDRAPAILYTQWNNFSFILEIQIINKQIGFSDNLSTHACFLDIDNAYNNILIVEVVKILEELNVGAKISKYL